MRWTGHIGDCNSQRTEKRNKIIKSTLFKKKVELKFLLFTVFFNFKSTKTIRIGYSVEVWRVES